MHPLSAIERNAKSWIVSAGSTHVREAATNKIPAISILFIISYFFDADPPAPLWIRSLLMTVAIPSERPAPVPTDAIKSAPSIPPAIISGMPEYSSINEVRAVLASTAFSAAATAGSATLLIYRPTRIPKIPRIGIRTALIRAPSLASESLFAFKIACA